MDLGLQGHRVIVSGATRGIGLAIARRFAREGAHVLVTGRGAADLKTAVQLIEADAPAVHVLAIGGDMTDREAIASACDAAERTWGGIDVAVANVGSGAWPPLFDATERDWSSALQVNLLAAVELARAVVPGMQRRRRGAFLAIASIAGLEAVAAPLPYVAAKSALLAFSKNLARSVAADGVRVNVLSPGNVLVPGGAWARRLDADVARTTAYIESEVPMRRFGRPEEVADVAVFACSDRASFMTGACLVADGGQTRGW
jgi:3-oxoacyl-[acyl-carrier protein] reductase